MIATGGGPFSLVADNASEAAITPDGQQLAFVSSTGNVDCSRFSSLVVRPVNSNVGARWYAPTGDRLTSPSWAPDSRHLAYILLGTGSYPRVLDTRDLRAALDGPPLPQTDGTGWHGYLGVTGDYLGDQIPVSPRPAAQLVALDSQTGAIKEPLTAITTRSGGGLRPTSDTTGSHILVVVGAPDRPTLDLYRWSRGERRAELIGHDVVSASWTLG